MGEEASDVPHPGVGYLRLVEAFYDLSAIGVAFTALIAGRPHRCRWLRHRRPFHKVGGCRQTFTDTRPACEAGDPTTRIA